MGLIGTQNEVTRQFVKVRTGDGVFTAIPIRGEDQGRCDLVVLGAPEIGGKGDKEGKRRDIPAQIMYDVPYGSKGRDGRNTLIPYWDEA